MPKLVIMLFIIIIVAFVVGGYFLFSSNKASDESNLGDECEIFPAKLDKCTEFKCQFVHPLTKENMTRQILGIIDGKCRYIETMPNNGRMECNYAESMRKAAAQYYEDVNKAESVETQVSIGITSGEKETKYTIDGKEVSNPLQEALNNGQCIISGYTLVSDSQEQPENTKTASYENIDFLKGTESFISNESCGGDKSCSHFSNFSFCFLGELCVFYNENFIRFVESNYNTFNKTCHCCGLKCENCEHGKWWGSFYAYDNEIYDNITLSLCVECDINDHDRGFGCNDGYNCFLGKCVPE